VALERAHPALLADHHGDRLVDHLDSATARFSAWISVRRSSPKGLGVGLDLRITVRLQRRRAAQDLFQLALLGAQRPSAPARS
jgi:hypothetical protein